MSKKLASNNTHDCKQPHPLVILVRGLREIGEPLSDEDIADYLKGFEMNPMVLDVVYKIMRKIGREKIAA